MMVYVEFIYVNVSGVHSTGEQEFKTPQMALRFMYKASKTPNMFIKSYRCDDPMDSEWLDKRFKL